MLVSEENPEIVLIVLIVRMGEYLRKRAFADYPAKPLFCVGSEPESNGTPAFRGASDDRRHRRPIGSGMGQQSRIGQGAFPYPVCKEHDRLMHF